MSVHVILCVKRIDNQSTFKYMILSVNLHSKLIYGIGQRMGKTI